MVRHHKMHAIIINRTGGEKSSLVHFKRKGSMSTSPLGSVVKPALCYVLT